jgi:hypothetical protein
LASGRVSPRRRDPRSQSFPLNVTKIAQPLALSFDVRPLISRVAGSRHVTDPWDFYRLLRVGEVERGKNQESQSEKHDAAFH